MGRRFEFRSREIELDFAGVKVTVPGTREYSKHLEGIGREMIAWGNDPANANAGDEVAKNFMLDILDELLGEDAMDKIEGERTLDLYDCTDMFKYIKDEVFAYHNGVVAEHTKPAEEPVSQKQPMAMAAAENREARRARERAERRAKRKGGRK